METPIGAELRTGYLQPVAVLLRVTCVQGYWKGAVHYHHILPPPSGLGRAWFDDGMFLKKTTSSRGIVRVASKCLLSDKSRIDEEIAELFDDAMEELRNIYAEDMVMMKDWVALRSDFDGEIVSYFLLVSCLKTLY